MTDFNKPPVSPTQTNVTQGRNLPSPNLARIAQPVIDTAVNTVKDLQMRTIKGKLNEVALSGQTEDILGDMGLGETEDSEFDALMTPLRRIMSGTKTSGGYAARRELGFDAEMSRLVSQNPHLQGRILAAGNTIKFGATYQRGMAQAQLADAQFAAAQQQHEQFYNQAVEEDPTLLLLDPMSPEFYSRGTQVIHDKQIVSLARKSAELRAMNTVQTTESVKQGLREVQMNPAIVRANNRFMRARLDESMFTKYGVTNKDGLARLFKDGKVNLAEIRDDINYVVDDLLFSAASVYDPEGKLTRAELSEYYAPTIAMADEAAQFATTTGIASFVENLNSVQGAVSMLTAAGDANANQALHGAIFLEKYPQLINLTGESRANSEKLINKGLLSMVAALAATPSGVQGAYTPDPTKLGNAPTGIYRKLATNNPTNSEGDLQLGFLAIMEGAEQQYVNSQPPAGDSGADPDDASDKIAKEFKDKDRGTAEQLLRNLPFACAEEQLARIDTGRAPLSESFNQQCIEVLGSPNYQKMVENKSPEDRASGRETTMPYLEGEFENITAKLDGLYKSSFESIPGVGRDGAPPLFPEITGRGGLGETLNAMGKYNTDYYEDIQGQIEHVLDDRTGETRIALREDYDTSHLGEKGLENLTTAIAGFNRKYSPILSAMTRAWVIANTTYGKISDFSSGKILHDSMRLQGK